MHRAQTRHIVWVVLVLLAFGFRTADAQTRVESVLAVPPVPSELRATDARLERLERWIFIVAKHSPGRSDELSQELASWSLVDLQWLWVDANTLATLMHADNRGAFTVSIPGGGTTRIGYSRTQLQRLQRAACLVSGFLDVTSEALPADHIARRCIEATPLATLGPILSELASWYAAQRRRLGDDNVFLRRSALAHSDVAMLERTMTLPIGASSLPVGPRRIRIELLDGRSLGITLGGIHWSLAETLLSFVTSAGEVRPNPERDAMVRSWYQATTMWLQRHEQRGLQHLQSGLALFPNDATLLFLSGCEHESYASDAIQVALDPSNRGAGSVRSRPEELRLAARAFAQSQELRASAETEMHLGRVSSLLGQVDEALTTLASITAPFPSSAQRYLFEMTMGDALERSRRLRDAADAYAPAHAIDPAAQSATLALSQVQLRADNRDAARESIGLWAAESTDGSEDPWWDYSVSHTGPADSLVEAVWQSVD